jgi:hypothetical protein
MIKNTIKKSEFLFFSKLFYFIILFSTIVLFPCKSFAQTPDVTANFVYPEFKITTTPEFPGLCPDRGQLKVEVLCNELYDSYHWEHVGTKEFTRGNPARLAISGMWCLTVKGKRDGVPCTKSKYFEVFDLSDPAQLKLYFENAGFYAIPIWRDEIINVNGAGSSNRQDCDIQPISLTASEASSDFVEKAVLEAMQEFKPIKDFNSSSVFSTNGCLCKEGGDPLKELEGEFGNGDAAFWAHEFFLTNEMSGFLFVKGRMPGDGILPNGNQRKHFNGFNNNGLINSIISNNPNEKAMNIITRNIFLPHPINGYSEKTLCPFELNEKETYVTPALVPFKGNADYIGYFTRPENIDGAMEGTIAWFASKNRSQETYQGFRFKENIFEGYVNELTGELFEGFTEASAFASGSLSVTKPILCEGNCKKSGFNIENSQFKLDGGLNFVIRSSSVPSPTSKENIIIGCIDEKLTNGTTISFISGTKEIVRLPCTGVGCTNIREVEFTYGAFTNAQNFNYKIVSGLLYRFKIEDANKEVIEYTYNNLTKIYESIKGPYINVPAVSNDNVVYGLACGNDYALYKVGKGDLEEHNSSSQSYYDDFDNFALKFRPFSSIFPRVEGPIVVKNGVNCLYCPSELTKIITEGFCGKPEHIYIDKIAQAATVFPAYFGVINSTHPGSEEYLQTFTDAKGVVNSPNSNWAQPFFGTSTPPSLIPEWQNLLLQNNGYQSLFNTNNPEFFKIFLFEFLKYIKKKDDSFWGIVGEAEWNKLTPQEKINLSVNHLKKEPQFIADKKPFETKKKIVLDALFKDVNFFNEVENAIIHIGAACNGSMEASQLITYLENKNIATLFNKFDDIGGSDNKTGLLTMLSTKLLEADKINVIDMKEYFDNPISMLQFSGNALWELSNFDYQIIDNTVKFKNPYTFPAFERTYNYNDLIPVYALGNFDIGNKIFVKGKVVNLTAIQLALFEHFGKGKKAERVGWVALDLGLMYVGVGAAKAIFSSANYLRKGTIIAEITGSTAAIGVQLLDNVDDELRTQIQLAALAFSGPEIGISLIEALGKVKVLRTQYSHLEDAVTEARKLRILAGEKDLADFPEVINLIKSDDKFLEAWESLLLAKAPKTLRTNIEFLKRLGNNNKIINIINNLDENGIIDFANDVTTWINRYDARPYLANGDYSSAVTKMGGTISSPDPWEGINYVGPMEGHNIDDINAIIASTDDHIIIANKLGIPEHVVERMKQHFFIEEHLVEITENQYKIGRFNISIDHVEFWSQVKKGNLENADQLKTLIAHEYMESKLMQSGLTYIGIEANASKYGAHELAILDNPAFFGFSHWSILLKRNLTPATISSNFSNIDDIVLFIKNIEGI